MSWNVLLSEFKRIDQWFVSKHATKSSEIVLWTQILSYGLRDSHMRSDIVPWNQTLPYEIRHCPISSDIVLWDQTLLHDLLFVPWPQSLSHELRYCPMISWETRTFTLCVAVSQCVWDNLKLKYCQTELLGQLLVDTGTSAQIMMFL